MDWLINYLMKGNLSKLMKLIKIGKVDMFYWFCIETTNNCNRRCSYCPISIDKNYRPQKMKKKLFYKVIDELVEIKFKGSIFPHNYGEPLLDGRLETFVEYIREKLPHVYIEIVSNGDILNQERLNSLIEAGVNSFLVTIHDDVGIPKKFNSMPHVKVQKIGRLCNRGGSVEIPNNRLDLQNKYCRVPSISFIVGVDGKVPLCCQDYFYDVLQGDLNKQTIMEIWNNPVNKARRDKISKGILEYDICKKCTGYNYFKDKE